MEVMGQLVDYRRKEVPDMLSSSERISINTNAADWLILMPNIGVEYDLRPEEWNRWALGFKLRGNWNTYHKYKPAQVYNLFEARVEVRNYYRMRGINKYFPKYEKWDILGKLFYNRRDSVRVVDGEEINPSRHPNITYYRGAYLTFSQYSMLVFGSRGNQGIAINAGVMFGVLKPLYQFANGRSIDLDLGISAGLCLTNADEFRHDRESNCYPITKKGSFRIVPFPVINEARVGLVYRFGDGSHPLTKKYRYRYDVDNKPDTAYINGEKVITPGYRQRYEDMIDRQDSIKQAEATRAKFVGELQQEFDRLFEKIYPEVLKKHQADAQQNAQKEADKKKAQEAAAKQAEADKKKAAADQKKAAAEQKKAAAEQKKAEKDAKKKNKKSDEAEKSEEAVKPEETEKPEATQPVEPTEATQPAEDRKEVEE